MVGGEAATLETAARVAAGFPINRLELEPQDKETTVVLDRLEWVVVPVVVAGHLPQVPQQSLHPVVLVARVPHRP